MCQAIVKILSKRVPAIGSVRRRECQVMPDDQILNLTFIKLVFESYQGKQV